MVIVGRRASRNHPGHVPGLYSFLGSTTDADQRLTYQPTGAHKALSAAASIPADGAGLGDLCPVEGRRNSPLLGMFKQFQYCWVYSLLGIRHVFTSLKLGGIEIKN
jgi:hypothetical protein